jgi:hypothetical protein
MEFSGETFRGISLEFAYSEDSLRRHKANHLAEDLQAVRVAMEAAREEALAEAKAREKEKIGEEAIEVAKTGMVARLDNAATFIDQLNEVKRKAAELLDKAETSNDLKTAALYIRELREQLRLAAELEGRLATQPQINVLVNPEWIELKALIISTLKPYPEAYEALIDALP